MFTWKSSFNITIPTNKLVSFPDLENSSYRYHLVVGQPITIQKLYHYLGVDPTSGNYLFESKSGPTSLPVYNTDNTVVINTAPKFYGGFENSFSYGSFQLNFLIQFVKQTGIKFFYNAQSLVNPGGFYSGYSNQPETVLERWQGPTQQNAAVQAFHTVQSPYDVYVGNLENSDGGYGDNSFLRLKNLSFSYALPKIAVQKMHISYCKIYLQGQNLITITKYKGLDPENQSVNALPPLRVLTAGIQFGL